MTAFTTEKTHAIPLELIATDDYSTWYKGQSEKLQNWVDGIGFKAQSGQFQFCPGDDGTPSRVLVGHKGPQSLSTLGHLPFKLPEGTYALSSPAEEIALIGWGFGGYRFDRYKDKNREPATLVWPDGENARVKRFVAATTLVRDLINTPTEHMLPSDLAVRAEAMADELGMGARVLVGDELLAENFPIIHTVGRASADAPRLIELIWGDPANPAITLVGKGVCFDSGGLDIKSAAGMRNMKKDMGGAAHVLGLAYLIVSNALPVRLRVLIPAVENAISANAYRPGDVLTARNGLTVEIDNTDAEGRLILADALALAAEEAPELIIDYATLTGAARVALGTELPAMFCNREDNVEALLSAGVKADDPVWRLPLHDPYGSHIQSKIADLVNSAGTPYGGAISAGLFLRHFVDDQPWIHFDVMGFNNRTRPGRPQGGEAMGMRAVFGFLEAKYG